MFDETEGRAAVFTLNVLLLALIASWLLNIGGVKSHGIAGAGMLASCAGVSALAFHYGRKSFQLKGWQVAVFTAAAAVFAFIAGIAGAGAPAQFPVLAAVFAALPPAAFAVRMKLVK